MEQKSIKFQLMLEPSLAHEIEEWGWQNRMRSKADAIRYLVRKGLSASDENEKAGEPLTA